MISLQQSCMYMVIGCGTLTLFRMGFFGAAQGWGTGQKGRPSLKSVTQTWHSYTLFKKIQKIYESRDTPLEFCLHQQFFNQKQQILLYQEIHV